MIGNLHSFRRARAQGRQEGAQDQHSGIIPFHRASSLRFAGGVTNASAAQAKGLRSAYSPPLYLDLPFSLSRSILRQYWPVTTVPSPCQTDHPEPQHQALLHSRMTYAKSRRFSRVRECAHRMAPTCAPTSSLRCLREWTECTRSHRRLLNPLSHDMASDLALGRDAFLCARTSVGGSPRMGWAAC